MMGGAGVAAVAVMNGGAGASPRHAKHPPQVHCPAGSAAAGTDRAHVEECVGGSKPRGDRTEPGDGVADGVGADVVVGAAAELNPGTGVADGVVLDGGNGRLHGDARLGVEQLVGCDGDVIGAGEDSDLRVGNDVSRKRACGAKPGVKTVSGKQIVGAIRTNVNRAENVVRGCDRASLADANVNGVVKNDAADDVVIG